VFSPYSVWRHISTLDCDMLVVKRQYQSTDGYYLKVRWINRRTGIDYGQDKVFVRRADVRKWSWVQG
jgi:hypothetical protein